MHTNFPRMLSEVLVSISDFFLSLDYWGWDAMLILFRNYTSRKLLFKHDSESFLFAHNDKFKQAINCFLH